ncbi:MAG: hypothetical protein ACJ73S_15730 [Mycobacteriales bacterium]
MADTDVVLAGANPAVLLRDGDQAAAFASLWLVDWSERGAGRVLFVVEPDATRMYGERRELADWLADTFVRRFGESARVGWHEPEWVPARPEVLLDTSAGLTATAADVTLTLAGVGPPARFAGDALGYHLSNVTFPCTAARLTRSGSTVTGTPDPAFLALAEVWSRP